MIRVRITETMISSHGALAFGDEVTTSDEQALEWIRLGRAERMAEPETATAKPAEKATLFGRRRSA